MAFTRATLKAGTTERRNGGKWPQIIKHVTAENDPNPKTWNGGKMTPNPKTRNGGKWPRILKHGTDVMLRELFVERHSSDDNARD